jgi:hypothetical protein
MKLFLLYICYSLSFECFSQKNSFDNYKQDTLQLTTQLNFKKWVGLQVNEAIIFMDFNYFNNQLYLERKGCKKQIRERQRIYNDKIVANQLAIYQRQYVTLDSIYTYLQQGRKSFDTMYVLYAVILKANSPFCDFIPKLIENGQCVITDKHLSRQPLIIRQIGWKKTSQMHSAGSRLYFIPRHENHFWSKWYWST